MSWTAPPGFSVLPVLILDEATSALDAETEATLLDRLYARFHGSKTVLFISHRESLTARADKILQINGI